jgi:Coproporphyrinogen III oxidase and related Fe-S oxidoreductases
LSSNAEFTVELHPLDVTEDKLNELKDLGVNRISMGVQSLDDKMLENMGRGYTAREAARAFELVKKHFDNAGIDLIVGYPGGMSRQCRKSRKLGAQTLFGVCVAERAGAQGRAERRGGDGSLA